MLTNRLHSETRSQEIKEDIKSIYHIDTEYLLTYETLSHDRDAGECSFKQAYVYRALGMCVIIINVCVNNKYTPSSHQHHHLL